MVRYTHCYVCGKPLPHVQCRQVKCWSCELERRARARTTPMHLVRQVRTESKPTINCASCGCVLPLGTPHRDCHHQDANHWNAATENIRVLCRRCHMKVDGRLEKLVTRNRVGRKAVGTKICPVCNITFTRNRASRLAKLTYCSHHCSAIARERAIAHTKRRHSEQQCLFCNRTFYPRSGSAGTFCSWECYTRYRQEHAIGPVSAGYRFRNATPDSAE